MGGCLGRSALFLFFLVACRPVSLDLFLSSPNSNFDMNFEKQARGGAEAPVPEFSVVFRFRAYSRRHETEPESISPQDVLRPGGRRARWLLRDGAVQRQSAVQRVAKIGILERGRSLGLVGLIYNTIYFVQSMMRSCPWCSCSCHFSCGVWRL